MWLAHAREYGSRLLTKSLLWAVAVWGMLKKALRLCRMAVANVRTEWPRWKPHVVAECKKIGQGVVSFGMMCVRAFVALLALVSMLVVTLAGRLLHLVMRWRWKATPEEEEQQRRQQRQQEWQQRFQGAQGDGDASQPLSPRQLQRQRESTVPIVIPTDPSAAVERIMAIDEEDFYLVLGVPSASSADELKRVFRKQSLLVHPDKNRSHHVRKEKGERRGGGGGGGGVGGGAVGSQP